MQPVGSREAIARRQTAREAMVHRLLIAFASATAFAFIGPSVWLAASEETESSIAAQSPAAKALVAGRANEALVVLERACLHCHDFNEARGGLVLETAESAQRGGDSGPVIVPGDPAASLLMQQVTGDPAAMPPDGPSLSEDDRAILSQWIAAGAPWPEGRRLQDRRFEAADWWSLRPPVEPPLAQIATDSESEAGEWLRHPIDGFVWERLEAAGLRPSPAADRRTLIRRLTFDLWGLPPDPARVAEFVADRDPLAYERLVDELLADPRYGERWARHWLDVVHYGETHGYDKDQPRPNAWPYRDYVIRSFNADRPYAEFVEQQLAGDVLAGRLPADDVAGRVDGIEATGFLAAGPWDLIGHLEVPETKIDGKIARHLDRDDMVTTTIQTFCSLTIQCAQCHQHKFDPLTQDDYYSLQAVFAAIDRTERLYDRDPERATRRRDLEQARDQLRTRRQAIEETVATSSTAMWPGELGARLQALSDPCIKQPEFGYHSQLTNRGDDLKWVGVTFAAAENLESVVLRPCHDEYQQPPAGFGFPIQYRIEYATELKPAPNWRVVANDGAFAQPNPGLAPVTIRLAEQGVLAVRVVATQLKPRSGDYMLALAELETWTADGRNVARSGQVIALDSIEAPIRWARSNLIDGIFAEPLPERRTELAELARQRQQMIDEIQRSPIREQLLQLRQLELDEGQLQAAIDALPADRVYAGAVHTGQGAFRGTGPDGGRPRPISILSRGNVQRPLREVGPGAIAAVRGLPARFLETDSQEHSTGQTYDPAHISTNEGQRRLALARWLTDPRHPLTDRSLVNRVWQYHFGRGLVATPNDFGRQGELPTHPELLDWLACRFRESGGSIKQLHRWIVTSQTYLQQSLDRPECSAIDPENRWLWRMNRRRLEAEAIRDSVLQVAGELQTAMYGASFRDFVVERPEHSPHYEYEQHDAADPATHRRSIYRFVVRSRQQPFLATFDCADPSLAVARRNESLSPLQALSLLNNDLMILMAARFSERLERSGGTLDDQLRQAAELALGRPADDELLAVLRPIAQSRGLGVACRVLFNLNEFVFVD